VQPSSAQRLVPLDSTVRATLKLELTGLRNQEGVICAALFDSSEGYPNDSTKAIRSGCFSIASNPCLLEFPDLPFGFYAVTVHHDENMDGELNCNALGIPKEGIGFSGNPRIWKGVPPFQRAEVEFSDRNPVIVITMKYLLR
jgi:uncharacterized protein (DUF2141 family)